MAKDNDVLERLRKLLDALTRDADASVGRRPPSRRLALIAAAVAAGLGVVTAALYWRK